MFNFFWKCMCFRNISHLAFGNQAFDWLTCLVQAIKWLMFPKHIHMIRLQVWVKIRKLIAGGFFSLVLFESNQLFLVYLVLKISTYLFQAWMMSGFRNKSFFFPFRLYCWSKNSHWKIEEQYTRRYKSCGSWYGRTSRSI